MPTTAIPSRVTRATIILALADKFRLNRLPKIFSLTPEEAASSWLSAVDMVAARMPARMSPARTAASTPFWLMRLAMRTIRVSLDEPLRNSSAPALVMVLAKIPARITPASSAATTPCWDSKLAICTIMVSLSARAPIAPFLTIAEPTTPITTAMNIEITTQMVAMRREVFNLRSSSMAINRSRMWGMPK